MGNLEKYKSRVRSQRILAISALGNRSSNKSPEDTLLELLSE